MLSTPYSVSAASQYADELVTASSSFFSFLGFTRCDLTGGSIETTTVRQPVRSVISTPALTTSKSSATIAPSASVPSPTSAGKTRETIGVAASVPATILAIVTLLIIIWRRRRRRKAFREHTAADDQKVNEHQPYLQRKAELEDEERRKHEFEARERRFELEGETELSEIPAGRDGPWLPPPFTQELRGEEHAKEMDAPFELSEESDQAICGRDDVAWRRSHLLLD